MANPAGESNDGALKLDFDRRLMLQFRGSVVTSDAGLLAYRELDDALGLSTIAGETLADARKNGQIRPSTTVRATRGADNCPNLDPVLQEGRKARIFRSDREPSGQTRTAATGAGREKNKRGRPMLLDALDFQAPLLLQPSPVRLHILNEIVADFRMSFPSVEYRLVLEKRIVNAQANRLGNCLCVTIYGGLALHPLAGQSAVTFAMLHETGHHLAPRSRPLWNPWFACECAADDWATKEGALRLREKTGRRLDIAAAMGELGAIVDYAETEPYNNSDASVACWALSWTGRKAAILSRCRLRDDACCCL
jgi:hypothetical protein